MFGYYLKMLKVLVFLNDIINVLLSIIETTQRLALRNIVTIQFNIIGIFTLEPKFSEFYSDCVNVFCLCHTCVRRRQQIWV